MTKSELAPGKMLLLGFQHVFAMFGATVLVPTLTGDVYKRQGLHIRSFVFMPWVETIC